ncbi:MAG: L,D-transpeptidase family protein [Solirubrobacteraceae bacterium]
MRALAPLTSLLVLLVLAAPAAAQTPPPEPRIAPGVKAGGLDVGNLTIGEAAVKLQQTYGAPLYNPISVYVGGRRFRLAPKQSGLKFDTVLTAKRALYAGRTNPTVDIPLATSLDKARVRTFARTVARKVHVRPRDATIRITLRHIFRRGSVTGRSLDVKALRAAITAALSNGTASHVLKPGRRTLRAKVSTNELARAYGTVITVDRANFRLRLFKRLKFSKSYGVAVGQPAYPTPTGSFQISNKQVNPAWTAPNSPWAGELAGTTTPGGSAANPLRARWMGIANGVGIHGTSQEYSIGSPASHGCIRMRVADVIDLFRRVPVGTPVLIR